MYEVQTISEADLDYVSMIAGYRVTPEEAMQFLADFRDWLDWSNSVTLASALS